MNKDIKRLTKLLVIKQKSKSDKERMLVSATEQLTLIQWQIDQEIDRIQRFKREYLNLMNRYDSLARLSAKDLQQREIYAKAVETKMQLAKNALSESEDRMREQEKVVQEIREDLLQLTLKIKKITQVKEQQVKQIKRNLENRIQSSIEERHSQRKENRVNPMNTQGASNHLYKPAARPDRTDSSNRPQPRINKHEEQAKDFAQLMKQQPDAIEQTQMLLQDSNASSGNSQEQSPILDAKQQSQIDAVNGYLNSNQSLASEPMARPEMAKSTPAATDVSQYIAQQVKQLHLSTEKSLLAPDPALFLKLSDPALDQTQLSLARSASGWSLNASGSSREQLELLRTNSTRLLKRFAESGLGEVTLTTEFKDDHHAFQSA